jgi:hypothetical protein
LAADLRRGLGALADLTGKAIKSVCPHEPSRTKQFRLPPTLVERFGLIEAYGDSFTKEMKYISDSSCRWREGCMHEFFERGVPRLCILTHGFWWYPSSPLENY